MQILEEEPRTELSAHRVVAEPTTVGELVIIEVITLEVVVAPHDFPAKLHLLDRPPQDIGMHGLGRDTVDVADVAVPSVIELRDAVYDVEGGRVGNAEAETRKDTPAFVAEEVKVGLDEPVRLFQVRRA